MNTGIPIICVVGSSGSGKTTLIEALVSGITDRGYMSKIEQFKLETQMIGPLPIVNHST
jgi:molybdopterin-guanine dinucleotide biosynthesis protein